MLYARIRQSSYIICYDIVYYAIEPYSNIAIATLAIAIAIAIAIATTIEVALAIA